MNKQKQLYTKSSPNSESYLLKKISGLLEKSIPKDVSGMLALAEYKDNSIIVSDRYHLKTIEPSNYTIYDSLLDVDVYQNIALFSSAVHILFCLKTNSTKSGFKDRIIYQQDQKYFRCVQNIKLYNHILKTAQGERMYIIANRLENDRVRLQQIKEQLFKIF